MDPRVAERLAHLPTPDAPTAVTPLGYTPVIARLDLLIDHLAETHATLAQLLELTARGKTRRRPVKHQPRPVTEVDRARRRAEINDMRRVAVAWFRNT